MMSTSTVLRLIRVMAAGRDSVPGLRTDKLGGGVHRSAEAERPIMPLARHFRLSRRRE